MKTESDLSYTVSTIDASVLPEIAALERACFSTPWSEESLSMLTQDGNVGFYVRMDGAVVGYGGMQCVLDEGQITDIAVHPDYRRRGIAAAILSAMIDYGRSNGLSVFFLEVRISNAPAIALYRDRFGFETLGTRRNFYQHPKEDAWNMRLLL
jgi:ribosomal-protein-alanine N-acetyltransferase